MPAKPAIAHPPLPAKSRKTKYEQEEDIWMTERTVLMATVAGCVRLRSASRGSESAIVSHPCKDGDPVSEHRGVLVGECGYRV